MSCWSSCVICVLKSMLQRVNGHFCTVSETGIDFPRCQSDRYGAGIVYSRSINGVAVTVVIVPVYS